MPLTLFHPLALSALLPLAATAALAMRRRRGRAVAVSSLALWRGALASSPGARRRRGRPTASWWLLLCGALAAVAALARPAWTGRSAGRTVAVVLAPSAELANSPGIHRLRGAADALLARLGRHDRVRLILPGRAGGAVEGLLTPEQARRHVGRVEPVPVPADALTLPPATDDVQHVYRFLPAGLSLPGGPRTTDVPLTTTTPAVALDALAAEPLGDGRVQVLTAVRNHASGPVRATLVMSIDAGEAGTTVTRELSLPGNARQAVVFDLPARAARIEARLGPAVGQRAVLTAERRASLRLALLGRPNAFLQRFAAAMEGVTLAGGTSFQAVAASNLSAQAGKPVPPHADAALAVGAKLPEGMPGVVFDPPEPPVGWRLADAPLGPLALVDAHVLADHLLLRDVELAGIAVRRSRPFVSGADDGADVLVAVDGGALLLVQPSPRRLYVAFDPGPGNTDWGMDESFPLLLANAIDWLSPVPPGAAYRLTDDSAGLLGLAVADARPVDISALPLPEPRPGPVVREFASALIVLAGLLWLAGWIIEALKEY